jgi:hypothetical protein
MAGRSPGTALDPTASLCAAELDAELGVRPIWYNAQPSTNSMAQYLWGLREPQAALAWLEMAMAGDTRRHTPMFAAISSLHLATILHALERHVAALDVLEGTLQLIEMQQTRRTAADFLLLRAVAEHNMAVQQLVLDRAPAAVDSCERAIATVRAYVATMQAQQKDVTGGSAGVELQLATSQIECTWLAAARVCEQPQRVRAASRLRDSRRSLLALAPLAGSRTRRARSRGSAVDESDRRPARSSTKSTTPTTHYSK